MVRVRIRVSYFGLDTMSKVFRVRVRFSIRVRVKFRVNVFRVMISS